MNISISEKEYELVLYGLEMLMSHKVYKNNEYKEIERLYEGIKKQKEEYEISTYTPDFDITLQHKH